MIPYRMNPLGSGWPREGSYGVFLTSSGAAVSSAIVMSGAVVDAAFNMSVYNGGRTRETSVLSGGSMTVYSGGRTSRDTVTNTGAIRVDGGILKSGTTQSRGVITVHSGLAEGINVINNGTAHCGAAVYSAQENVGKRLRESCRSRQRKTGADQ